MEKEVTPYSGRIKRDHSSVLKGRIGYQSVHFFMRNLRDKDFDI